MANWKKYRKTNPKIDIGGKSGTAGAASFDSSQFRVRSLQEKSADARRKAQLIGKMIPALQKLKDFRNRDPKIRQITAKLNSKVKKKDQEKVSLAVNYWLMELE